MKQQVTSRVRKLEQEQANRARASEGPYPAHTKKPIDYAAVNAVLNAVLEEMLDTAPMGWEAALRLMINSIPSAVKRRCGLDESPRSQATAPGTGSQRQLQLVERGMVDDLEDSIDYRDGIIYDIMTMVDEPPDEDEQ